MIVIDASVLVAFLLNEPRSKDLDPYISQSLVSVDLIMKETANALIMAFRKGFINEQSMHTVFGALLKFNMLISFREQQDLMIQAFNWALELNLTVYDSLYLVAAQTLSLPLLTLDNRLRQAAEKRGVEVIP